MLINEEVQRQVLPVLARATSVPTPEAQQRAGTLLQLSPGQQVKAEIVANLPNNLYLARIAGEMFKLEIPLNIQPGETMEMTFVSAEPKITFQVFRSDGGTSVSLSSMGRWLSGVVNDGTALAPESGTLLESPAQGALLLGERLKAALTQGGLFYEAHLAQWAAGGRALEEILKEPQGRLSRGPGGVASEGEEAHPAGEFADPRTVPLVKEQLLLLNSGVLSWKGEAWPGQGMEIAIQPREEEGEREIEATLDLELPGLGGIQARLRFGREGLRLEFVCGNKGAAAVLKEGGGELRRSLASAGVQLTGMVARDEAAAG